MSELQPTHDEWLELIIEAKEIGLSIEEVEQFLNSKRSL